MLLNRHLNIFHLWVSIIDQFVQRVDLFSPLVHRWEINGTMIIAVLSVWLQSTFFVFQPPTATVDV